MHKGLQYRKLVYQIPRDGEVEIPSIPLRGCPNPHLRHPLYAQLIKSNTHHQELEAIPWVSA